MIARADLGHRDVIRAAAVGAVSYLEIGVREGDSLRAALEAEPGIKRLLLCDTWDRNAGGTGRGGHEHIEALLTEIGFAGSVQFLDGRSQETLPALPAGALFDLVHVDGDHSHPGALADLRSAWSLTAPGGRMVVHDVTFRPVWQAVAEFAKEAGDASASLAFGDRGTVWFDKGVTA